MGCLRQIRGELECSADFHTNNRLNRARSDPCNTSMYKADQKKRYYGAEVLSWDDCITRSNVVAFRAIFDHDCWPINPNPPPRGMCFTKKDWSGLPSIGQHHLPPKPAKPAKRAKRAKGQGRGLGELEYVPPS